MINRTVHKLVGYGRMNVTDEPISDVIDIRDVARK